MTPCQETSVSWYSPKLSGKTKTFVLQIIVITLKILSGKLYDGSVDNYGDKMWVSFPPSPTGRSVSDGWVVDNMCITEKSYNVYYVK